MPHKHNKKSSSTTRQTRSVTRARNSAARPSTPSGDVSLPGRNIPSTASGEDVSPRWNSNTTLSSRYVPTSLNSLSPRRNTNPGNVDNNNIPALRRSENPSSYIPAPSNILSPRRTASPGREHSNGLASRYVPTPPNILDFRRATNSAREHSPLSFRQTATNPARELNSFSFRHPATPLNASNPPREHSLFSFRHPSSPLTASSSRRGSSPPGMFNTVQASHRGRIPSDVNNDTRHPFSPPQFHSARLASNTASTPPSVSASLQATTPGLDNIMLATPPVPTPLLGRSSPRFHSERQTSFPNPTTLNNMSPQITFNRVRRVFHPSRSPPRFGTARPAVLPTPHNPRQSPGFHNATLFSPPAAAHTSTIPPPAFLNAIPPSSPVPTPLNSRRPPRFRNACPPSLPLPTPLSGMSPRYHNASLFSDNGPSPPRMAPRFHNAGLLIHDGPSSSAVRASPRTDDPPSFRNNLASRYVVTPPRQSNVLPPSVPPRMSINLATKAISPRQLNAFDTTVDLTDSPLVSPTLNTTVDLSDSPMAAAPAPRTPAPGSFLPPDNSPATPGTSPIKCPVCLDSHGRILLSGRKLMSTVCGHIFCSACLPTCINSNGRCPTCRRRLRNNHVHPIHI